jgi:hypothetical protein
MLGHADDRAKYNNWVPQGRGEGYGEGTYGGDAAVTFADVGRPRRGMRQSAGGKLGACSGAGNCWKWHESELFVWASGCDCGEVG